MPNPTTLIDGEERLNSEITRDYVCDACDGELTERYDPDPPEGGSHWVVQCASDPGHHGFTKRMTAHIRQRREEFRGRD